MGALQADASYVETEELACSCASLVPWASNSTVLMAQAEMPLLVSSQGSDVSSCLCIYHTCTSPSSSSTAHPRVQKQTQTDPVTSALRSLIFHHQSHTEGREFAPKSLHFLLLLVCSQKTSTSHLAACQLANRKPPVSPLAPTDSIYPPSSTNLPIKCN